jgi:hypothetical protein
MARRTESRRFAVRGVLRYFWRFRGRRRGTKVAFESRIVVIDARSERDARARAHRMFAGENRTATGFAADIVRESVTYVGISGLLEFGVEMEPEEVWWEFTDRRPRLVVRAPKA